MEKSYWKNRVLAYSPVGVVFILITFIYAAYLLVISTRFVT